MWRASHSRISALGDDTILTIEAQDGFWIFYNPKTGEEITEPLDTQTAIDFIWSIHAKAKR